MCSELDDLHTALGGDPQRIETQRKREQMKLKLELLEQRQAHAAQVRARVKWVEKGEKLRHPPPPPHDITDQQHVLNKPGLLVAIDYFHAFDCISKDFITAFQNSILA